VAAGRSGESLNGMRGASWWGTTSLAFRLSAFFRDGTQFTDLSDCRVRAEKAPDFSSMSPWPLSIWYGPLSYKPRSARVLTSSG
jgi:hypothetical protein